MSLVVFTYGAIGDYLMLLSAFRAAHAVQPDLRLTAVTTRSGGLLRALSAAYPYVTLIDLKAPGGVSQLLALGLSNNVIVPPTFGTAPAHFKRLGRFLSFLPRSRFIGFEDRGKSRYSTTLSYDNDAPYHHNLIRAFASAGVSIPDASPTYEFEPTPEVFNRLHIQEGAYVVFHPFASNEKRGLPQERMQRIVEKLATEFPKKAILVTGGKEDAEEAVAIAGTQATAVAGALSLSELATVLKSARIFIGVDTGITHMASMLQVPSVVLGNRSNPSWLPTYNPNAHILYEERDCTCAGDKTGDCTIVVDGKPYFRCLYGVSDERIAQEIDVVLATNKVETKH